MSIMDRSNVKRPELLYPFLLYLCFYWYIPILLYWTYEEKLEQWGFKKWLSERWLVRFITDERSLYKYFSDFLERNVAKVTFYSYNPLFFVGGVLLVIGLFFSVRTDSCVGAWVGMEINLVGLMGIFAVRESLSIAVKVKYFVIQCIASSIFLVGILRVKRGSLGYSSNLVLFADALVQMGLIIKVGAFPVHT